MGSSSKRAANQRDLHAALDRARPVGGASAIHPHPEMARPVGHPLVGAGSALDVSSVAAADLNGGGKADLAIANATSSTVSVLLNL